MKTFVALYFLTLASLLAQEVSPGSQAIVIYNSSMPESKGLAQYYANKRQVPANQVIGLDLPKGETMTRSEYTDKLEKPLLKYLQKNFLFVMKENLKAHAHETNFYPVASSKIRYATLCYGVPLKILNDPRQLDDEAMRLPAALRRNDAAVDSELCLLPLGSAKPKINGVKLNLLFGATNASVLNPTNGILMVGRLDGPTADMARGLVDRALEAEKNGCWGRAYFDMRGITNGDYKLGDDLIRGASEVARHYGFDTIIDDAPGTFSVNYPMSQIGLYAGWYDGDVSGPFTRPQVEFMPGAIAYHLHSFSAQTIRTVSQHWVGPLVAKGVTATLGCVEEPYLEGTPNIHIFFARLMALRFTFGEAAYACQASLSWQTTVVGDPLYNPFGWNPGQLHEELNHRKSRLVDWSHIRVVNLNQSRGAPLNVLTNYFHDLWAIEDPESEKSAVLQEKLGDIYQAMGKSAEAFECYRKALDLQPTPVQKVRLLQLAVRAASVLGDEEATYQIMRRFIKEAPDYGDPVTIYKTVIAIAEKLKKTNDVVELQRELSRLK